MTQTNASPKLYYGWIIAGTLAITETVSYGIVYYAFTVFITPMEADLGWTRTELTGAFSLALLIMAGMSFPVGYWVDKHGARLMMTLGSITATFLMIAWSQVTDVRLFYLIWIGLGVCGATIFYDPAFAVVATWFHRKRSTALAIITFAAGLASTIFVPLSDALLNAVGWRSAVLILGVMLGVTTIPLHAFFLRRRPDDMGLMPDGGLIDTKAKRTILTGVSLRDALHSRLFWMLTLAFGLAGFSAQAIRVHFIPYLIDVGIESSTAAVASGAIGVMQVLGRLVFAPLDSRVSIRTMVAGIFALQAGAMGILLFNSSIVGVVLFIVVFGSAYGATTLARPSIVAEVYGTVAYGRISSVMSTVLIVSGTLAPISASIIYDSFGSYTPMLFLIIALGLGAVGIIFLTGKEYHFKKEAKSH